MVDLGTPLKIQWGQKWYRNQPSGTQNRKIELAWLPREPPVRDPAFHETTVLLVPLGPSVFKNIIFSMMIGYFSVFFAFRCAMFYMSFLSHLLIKPR